MKQDELVEKVIKHDYEFEALSKSLKDIVKELHTVATSMKNIAAINEQIANMDNNIKESFMRVHDKIENNEDEIKKLKLSQDTDGCHALKLKVTEINALNRTTYGKDGRGGLVFDVDDIKKFIYKMLGAFTVLNIVIGASIAYVVK